MDDVQIPQPLGYIVSKQLLTVRGWAIRGSWKPIKAPNKKGRDNSHSPLYFCYSTPSLWYTTKISTRTRIAPLRNFFKHQFKRNLDKANTEGNIVIRLSFRRRFFSCYRALIRVK